MLDFLSMSLGRVNNQLLYVVYGDDPTYHIETKLSILSALRHTPQPNFTIRVMTDSVAEYSGWPVEVLPLTGSLLDDWLAETKYHFRRKAMGILSVLEYADKTLFVDTDTCFKGDVNGLFQLVDKGFVLVDRIYGRWGKAAKGSKDVIREYLAKYHPEFDESLQVINSGVLGFSQEDKPLLEKTVKFIDELYVIAPQFRELEQFAVTLAIHKQRQIVVQDRIYHYYSKKEFFHEMGKYFFKKYGAAYSFDFPEKSKEMLTTVVRPPFLTRLTARLKIRSFPKQQRSGLLKLLYALALDPTKQKDYEATQIVAYWSQAMRKDFSRYNPEAYSEFAQGRWPTAYQKIASPKQQQALLSFLKNQGIIN